MLDVTIGEQGMRKLAVLMTIVCLGLLVFPGGVSAQTCTPPPSGLVSWWPGDGNADDIAGTIGTLRDRKKLDAPDPTGSRSIR